MFKFLPFILCSFSLMLGSPVPDASAAVTATGQSFIPDCEKHLCPVLTCANQVRAEGECCARCEDEDEGVSARTNQCIFNGFLIEHGQTFHPGLLNVTDENSSNPYCISCTCSNGHIECNNHTSECPELDCPGTSFVPDRTCCPVCPTLPIERTTTSTSRKPDCRDIDGRTFYNGDEWHPAYPPLGLITCINCTCVDSRSVCVKLPCPEGPLPPCDPNEPVDNLTLCCPKCTPVFSSEPVKAETTIEIPINATIQPVIITTCLKGHTIKVWQHRVSRELAMEDIKMTEGENVVVTLWKWQSTNGTYNFRTTTESFHFSHIATNFNFRGWTKPARINRLSSDPKKKQKIDECRHSCYETLLQLLRVREDCDNKR